MEQMEFVIVYKKYTETTAFPNLIYPLTDFNNPQNNTDQEIKKQACSTFSSEQNQRNYPEKTIILKYKSGGVKTSDSEPFLHRLKKWLNIETSQK